MRQASPISPSMARPVDAETVISSSASREPSGRVLRTEQAVVRQREGFGQLEAIRSRPGLLELGEDRGGIAGDVRLLGGESDPQAPRQGTVGIEGGEGPALQSVDPRPFERRAVFVHPDPAETERRVGQALRITCGVGDLRVAPELVAGLPEAPLLQQRVPGDHRVP